MKQTISLGIVCLARKTFDYQAALDIYKKIQRKLQSIKAVNWIVVPELIIEIEDGIKAANVLEQNQVDGLICISGTFHLGHLILELNKRLNCPIMLWALNELPYTGGKIRLNSVCGVNLNASNLYKANVRNFHINIGDKVDEDWIDAIRVNTALKKAHIGIAGFRAHGFFNLGVYDLKAYEELGVLVDHYELSDIWNIDCRGKNVKQRKNQISQWFDISELNEYQLDKVAMLCDKLDQFIEKNHLSALAIRCWPEFADNYGISPCAAMSVLQSEHKILACEGDVEGALSMIAQQAIGGETPFLADFSQVNLEEDYALLWHCGVAPCNLWDGKCNASLDTYFAGGRGVTVGFVMKTEDVSLLRLDSTGEEYRLFLQKATGLPMEKELKGTYLKTRFKDNIRDVLDKVVYNGIAHHISMVYGDFIRPFEIFARIKGWKVIQ